MRNPLRGIFVAATLLAGAAHAEEHRPEIPAPPPVPNSAALCLPLLFLDHMSCLNGTPVAFLDSCRIMASRSSTILNTETRRITERELMVRRIEMALNRDEITTMINDLYATFENSDDNFVQSSLSPNETRFMAAFMIPVLEETLERLDESGVCEPVGRRPQLSFSR